MRWKWWEIVNPLPNQRQHPLILFERQQIASSTPRTFLRVQSERRPPASSEKSFKLSIPSPTRRSRGTARGTLSRGRVKRWKVEGSSVMESRRDVRARAGAEQHKRYVIGHWDGYTLSEFHATNNTFLVGALDPYRAKFPEPISFFPRSLQGG